MTKIIYSITALLAICFAVNYYVHMFQLNGYHRDGHLRWFGDNLGAFAARMTFALISFPLAVIANNVTLFIASILNLLTVFMYLPRKAKKPLVYTMRIKRLLVTNAIVYILLFAAGTYFKALFFLEPLSLLLVNFIVLFCDILNSPLEKAVKQHFINDAVKLLRARKSLTVIGITGSYGKTSTKYFLTKLLSTKYNVLMTPQSYNTPMGVVKTVREMLKPSHEIFICEMGAKNIGDIKELCDIVKPAMGIITSIGPQHLESFKTIENVADTKFELAKALPSDGKIYLNFDNEYIRNYKVNVQSVSYGMIFDKSDCLAQNISVSENGTDFDINYKGKTIHLSTKLLGSHNVQNITGCAAIALDMGVSENELVMAVKRLEPVPHRLQMIDGGSIAIIDDAFNANPTGTKAALEVMSGFDGVKIVVTPGMIELGSQQKKLNFEFGELCVRKCDYVFIVGGKIGDDVYDGAKNAGADEKRLVRFETVQQAVDAARQLNCDKKKFVLLENDLPDNY